MENQVNNTTLKFEKTTAQQHGSSWLLCLDRCTNYHVHSKEDHMAIFIVQFLCLPIPIIIYAVFSLRVFSFQKTLMKNVFDMLSGILKVFYGHVGFLP